MRVWQLFILFNCKKNNLKLADSYEDWSAQCIEKDTFINQYISIKLIEGEWKVQAKIIAYSEIYNLQIQVFSSIVS